MSQIRWSCIKLGGPESNMVLLSQISQSRINSGGPKSNYQFWMKSVKLSSPEVKFGGPESNQEVVGNSGSPGSNQLVLS